MYERLDEFGIDFMLAYPSWSLGMLDTRDDELRAPMLRAVNRYISRLFTPYQDRLTSAALIPMATPAGGRGRAAVRRDRSSASSPSSSPATRTAS